MNEKSFYDYYKWHKVPAWFATLPAAMAWAFGYCHTQIVCLDPLLFSREYDLYFFHLWETSGGKWYIRIG